MLKVILILLGLAFADGATPPHQINVSGNVVLNGSGAYQFGGNGYADFIWSPVSADWQLGIDDFQIDVAVSFNSVSNDGTTGYNVISQRGGASNIGYSFFHYAGNWSFVWTTNGTTFKSVNAVDPISVGQSNSYTVARVGGTVTIKKNGTVIGNGSIGQDAIYASSQPLRIGADSVNIGGCPCLISNIQIQRTQAAPPPPPPAQIWATATELHFNPDNATLPSIDKTNPNTGLILGYLNTATGIGPPRDTWQIVNDLTTRFAIPSDAKFIDISCIHIISQPVGSGIVIITGYAAPSSNISMANYLPRSISNQATGGQRGMFTQRVPLENINGEASYKWWWAAHDWAGNQAPYDATTYGVNCTIMGWGK